MYSAHCIGCLLLAQLFLAGAPWCYRILLTMHHVAIESCLFILVFSLFLASFLVLKDIYVGIDWFYILSFFPFLSVLLFLGALGYSQSDGTETHHLKKSFSFSASLKTSSLGFWTFHQQITLEGYTFSASWLPPRFLPARIQATMVFSVWSFLWSHGHHSTCPFSKPTGHLWAREHEKRHLAETSGIWVLVLTVLANCHSLIHLQFTLPKRT